jgi:uncharacterized repeat protein (TIGR03803 family)
LTTLYSFSDQPVDAHGRLPQAGLVQGSDGNFYGTTTRGGTGDNGTVFKITANGTLTTLYSFTGGEDGANPQAALVQGRDGSFYGTTGNGRVFKISANGTFSLLYSFSVGADGHDPQGALVQGSDGNFYGTTFSGGASAAYGGTGGGYGTVFKFSANGTLTTLYSFSGFGADGYNPETGLVQGKDGNFYGTTSGAQGSWQTYLPSGGTVFKINANGALTTLHSFTGDASPNGLVQGSDGNFYGTTYAGGEADEGTVFQISAKGACTNLYSFFVGGAHGRKPLAALIQGRDGNFYGTTSGWDGAKGYGTVDKISTNGTVTTLYTFTGGADGGTPTAALVQGSDGNFYGTTTYGGTGDYGTVFQLSANGTLTTLHSFSGGADGGYPAAALVQGSDGNFYGTTPSGGTGGNGTIFQLNANGLLTTLHSFSGGATPNGLVQGSDGNFYGTTTYGGTGGYDTVFRISINPPLQISGAHVAGNQFGFSITGPVGAVAVVQTCADLGNPVWTPVSTNTLTRGKTPFTDAQFAKYPRRFYRVQTQ